MNKTKCSQCLLILLLAFLGASAVSAQESEDEKSIAVISEAVQSLYLGNNFAHVGLRFMGAAKVSFKGFGDVPITSNINPFAGTNVNRGYDDGAVVVDNTGNANGTSRYWNYVNSSQVTSNGDIAFHAYSMTGIDGGGAPKSKANYGLELDYAYHFGHLSNKIEWGFEAGFGFNGINSAISGPVTGTLETTTDVYSLNGATPPGAPYTAPSSSVDANGNTIDTTVPIGAQPISRTVADSQVTVIRRWQIKGAYYAIHFGPVLRFSASDRIKITVSGGAEIGYFGTTFTADESSTVATAITSPSSTLVDRRDLAIVGYYGETNLEYWVTDRTGFYAGLTYEKLGSYNQSLGNRVANIDLSSSVGFRFGIVTRF